MCGQITVKEIPGGIFLVHFKVFWYAVKISCKTGIPMYVIIVIVVVVVLQIFAVHKIEGYRKTHYYTNAQGKSIEM